MDKSLYQTFTFLQFFWIKTFVEILFTSWLLMAFFSIPQYNGTWWKHNRRHPARHCWDFSKHRPFGPMLFISQMSVCVCVRVSVHFLRYRLNIVLPPLPEVGYPKNLEIWNPCGKVVEIAGLRFKYFCSKNGLKLPRQEKFFTDFLKENFFTFEVPFKHLFAPTSGNRMSNIFRDLESLGKINGKNWSQMWTFLSQNGLKLQWQKKVFYSFFSLCSPHKNILFSPLSEVQCPNFLDFLNPCGKLMKEVISDLNTFAHKECKMAAHFLFFFFRQSCLTSRIF